MGQVDEWGTLTNLTLCLIWEHTVYTGNFPKTYAHPRSRLVTYTWNEQEKPRTVSE